MCNLGSLEVFKGGREGGKEGGLVGSYLYTDESCYFRKQGKVM